MSDHPLGTVLIIDDENIDQYQYHRILKKSGMAAEIVTFDLATDALDWLQEHPDRQVDLILLDMNMPRMNGIEFLDAASVRLRSMGTRVLVMLTTELSERDRVRVEAFEEVGALFEKPLTQEHLDQARLQLEGQRA